MQEGPPPTGGLRRASWGLMGPAGGALGSCPGEGWGPAGSHRRLIPPPSFLEAAWGSRGGLGALAGSVVGTQGRAVEGTGSCGLGEAITSAPAARRMGLPRALHTERGGGRKEHWAWSPGPDFMSEFCHLLVGDHVV